MLLGDANIDIRRCSQTDVVYDGIVMHRRPSELHKLTVRIRRRLSYFSSSLRRKKLQLPRVTEEEDDDGSMSSCSSELDELDDNHYQPNVVDHFDHYDQRPLLLFNNSRRMTVPIDGRRQDSIDSYVTAADELGLPSNPVPHKLSSSSTKMIQLMRNRSSIEF